MVKSILQILLCPLLLLIVVPSDQLFAQEQYNTLLKAEKAQADNENDKAKFIYKSMMLNASEKLDTTMAYAFANMAFIYMMESKRDSMLLYYEKGFEYYKIHNDAYRQRYFLNAISESCRMWKDYDCAKEYNEQAIHVEGPIEEQYIGARNEWASMLTRNGELDSAEYILERNLELIDSLDLVSAFVWQHFGKLEQKRGNYPRAISHFTKCIEAYQTEPVRDKSPLFISNMYQTIARLFLQLDNFPKTHEILDKAEEIAVTNNFKRKQRLLLLDRGIAFLPTNPDSALVYLEKFNGAIGENGKVIDVFSVNVFLAQCHLTKGDLSKSEQLLSEANGIINQIKKDDQKLLFFRTKGVLETQRGNFAEAIIHLDRALELAEITNYEKNTIQILGYLQEAHAKSGNIRKAYQLQTEYQKRKEAITNLQSQQLIYEFEGKFQKAQQELEISNLTLSNKDKDQKIAEKNRLLYSGLLGLLGISLLGWQSYRLYRSKKKSNILLEERNEIISTSLSEKELLLKEIHHRVKNNLQVVSSLLSLQSEYIKDDTALSALNEGRNRVKSMALIHQNLYQEDHLTGIKVQAYFTKLVSGLFDSYNISEQRIQLQLDVDDIVVDVDTIVPLGLIANELISNALKYAYDPDQSGSIDVTLKQNGGMLILHIADQGKGFDISTINENISSFGYQMIQAFCTKLNANMSLNNESGTEVTISLTH